MPDDLSLREASRRERYRGTPAEAALGVPQNFLSRQGFLRGRFLDCALKQVKIDIEFSAFVFPQYICFLWLRLLRKGMERVGWTIPLYFHHCMSYVFPSAPFDFDDRF